MKELMCVEIHVRQIPVLNEDNKRFINYEIPSGMQPPDHYRAIVYVDYTIENFSKMSSRFKQWCHNNCNSLFQIVFIDIEKNNSIYHIRFQNKNDLLKFKLSWG